MADFVDNGERIMEFQDLAPVHKFEGIQAALAAQRFVDGRSRPLEPGGKRTNGQVKLGRPFAKQPSQCLVFRSLKRLFGRKRLGLLSAGSCHTPADTVYPSVP